MPDIFQDFPIKSSVEKIFNAISTPVGLDTWWTKSSSGTPAIGQEYKLGFGPQYDWRAVVTKCIAGRDFEIRMTTRTPIGRARWSDFSWKANRKWFGFDFITPAGPPPTNTFEFRTTVGQCTCAFCDAIWKTASLFRMKID